MIIIFLGFVLTEARGYSKLSTFIVLYYPQVCLASRSRNGGIISVTEVQKILAKRKTRLGAASAASEQKVSKADINIAIGKLAKLGGGFRTVQVGKSTMIISVPQELDNDHMQVMAVATDHQTSTQGITVDDVTVNTGWDRERAQRGLDLLLTEGIAWLDEYQGVSYYWLSSVWKEQQEGGATES
jgi:ESCRT-II complex subunit VPS22